MDNRRDDGWQALRHWPDAEMGGALGGGSVNDIREVRLDGERLVGRLTQRSDADLAWEVRLITALDEAGLGVPKLVPTASG